MITKIMSLINKFIPVGIAVKGLEKLDPRFKKYFSAAIGAGYGADQAIDFLRSRLSPESQGSDHARPQEESANIDVERSYQPQKIAAGLGGAALGGLSGAALGAASEIGSNLPKEKQPISYKTEIPSSFEEPDFGETIVKHGKEHPAKLEREKMRVLNEREGAVPEKIQEQLQQFIGNIIAQYSPELSAFLEEQIQSGRDPLEAGAIAQSSGKYQSVIQKMQKDLKRKFSDILSEIYGGTQKQRQATTSAQQKNNQADEAIFAALDKILKM